MQPGDRLHALDAVRAYALLLGVVLHSAAAFVEGFPIPTWYVEPSTTATLIYYVIHMFRMSAFFLIAGFFARMVVERRGIKAFVKDRGKRIAIPLFLFGPFVLIFIAVGFILGALVHGPAYLQEMGESMNQQAQAVAGDAAQPAGAAINTAHLWFLYYLLIFYALTLVIRSLIRAIDSQQRLANLADRVIAFVMRGVWGPVIIAVPLVLYFAQRATWNEWLGLPAPFSFVPDMNALVGYGIAFGLGWLLHRQIPLLLDLKKLWYVYLGAAIVLTVVCLRIVDVQPNWVGATLAGTDRVIYTAAYMIGAWCWIFAFVGAAVQFLSNESPVNRYLADASYWIYLMHLATIQFFIALLRPYDLHWSILLFVYIVGSMPILLASYHWFVRYTWIGAVLNGRRHPRPNRPPPADTATVTG